MSKTILNNCSYIQKITQNTNEYDRHIKNDNWLYKTHQKYKNTLNESKRKTKNVQPFEEIETFQIIKFIFCYMSNFLKSYFILFCIFCISYIFCIFCIFYIYIHIRTRVGPFTPQLLRCQSPSLSSISDLRCCSPDSRYRIFDKDGGRSPIFTWSLRSLPCWRRQPPASQPTITNSCRFSGMNSWVLVV